MNRRLFFFSAIAALLLGLANLAPIRAAAQTTANGPYYAWPAWDQQMQCNTKSTCPRFIVLSNWRDADFPDGGAAVLDRETGLVWERSPSTETLDWQSAQRRCNRLRTGNRMGWRLPTLQELASLVEPREPTPGQLNPGIPNGHPFTIALSTYWSATTLAGIPTAAWSVTFSAGGGVGADDKAGFEFVWCVRGGHGVDPQ